MGIEVERFLNYIPNELICSICTDVVDDPRECSDCETSFCKKCIEDWMSRSQLCPNRCNITLRQSHRIIRSMLESQELKCRRYKEGCPYTSDLAKIKLHEEENCPFRTVKCIHPDCNEYIYMNKIQSHESSCPYIQLTCPKCQGDLQQTGQEHHSCIPYFKDMIDKLEEISITQLQEIQRLENAILSRSQGYQQMHPGVRCQECGVVPIIGIRFKCLSCEVYDLCEVCMADSPHDHNFIPMENSADHEGVTCDVCNQFPIIGLRYKCRICGNIGMFYHRPVP